MGIVGHFAPSESTSEIKVFSGSNIKDNFTKMGDNPDDLPYRAEYAKSGRAKCKGCKVEIPKGDMRLAAMTQVWWFFSLCKRFVMINSLTLNVFSLHSLTGKQANWFHSNCFFTRNRPTAVGEI